jgi:hypothetical protein
VASPVLAPFPAPVPSRARARPRGPALPRASAGRRIREEPSPRVAPLAPTARGASLTPGRIGRVARAALVSETPTAYFSGRSATSLPSAPRFCTFARSGAIE